MDSSSDRNPVEELAEEFMDRKRRGENPALTEYTQKFPQWAEEIEAIRRDLSSPSSFPSSSTATPTLRANPKIRLIGWEYLNGGRSVIYHRDRSYHFDVDEADFFLPQKLPSGGRGTLYFFIDDGPTKSP